MIRPITVFCWILALGAGLYLYRAKHDVELMDQHIDQIAKKTAELRAQSRSLLDDWIRLGEPEQLHKYSNEYLGLQPIAPGQFARLGDLATRLPAPRADPPVVQPDAVVEISDDPSSAVVAGGVQAATSAGAGTDELDEANADDLPIPPIPPAGPPPPITTVSLQAVTALPLQARPVTPRATAVPPEQDAARPRLATPAPTASPHVAEEPNATPAKMAPTAGVDPRPGTPGQTSRPISGPATGQPRALPPLQAQGPGSVQGLPPLQSPSLQAQMPAQGAGRSPVQGPALAPTQGQQAFRPADPAVADTRANEPRRDVRPIPPQQAQAYEPRGTGTPAARPGPAPVTASPPAGSLLGMARGTVPLPLPSPTPVSASWQGSSGSGPIGPGR